MIKIIKIEYFDQFQCLMERCQIIVVVKDGA